MLVDSGRSQILKQITGLVAQESYNMGLFINNYTVVEGTTLGNLTEASNSGYARQTMSGWSTPSGPVAGVWTSTANNVTFSNTSGVPVTIYGYFYIGLSTGILYGGGNFAGGLVLPAGGSLIFSPSWNDTTN